MKNFSDKIVNLVDTEGHFSWTNYKQSLDGGSHNGGGYMDRYVHKTSPSGRIFVISSHQTK